MPRVGGPVPDSYGLSLTVKVPIASEANPIDTGDLLVWDATGANTMIPAPDGALPQGRAKHPVSDPFTPLGVHVFGTSPTRVEQIPYTGAAPALGASVVANGTGGVRALGASPANHTRVLFVDTARKIVEILI